VQDLYGLAAYRILSKKLPGVGHLVGQYFMYLDRCSARASDAVVVITEDFVPYMEREGIRRERIHVVPNWAPIESLPVEVKDNAWARSQGLSPQPVRFLYSGTLSIRHNPELLVQLALRLEQWKNAELVVISVGPGIDHIRRRAEELSLTCVKLLPFQPFENMAEVFGSADVLVSILEPDAGVFCVPSKVLSYMCAGRSQLVGMPLENLSARLVEGNGMGLVSAADDVDDFLKNAETLYRDSEMRDLCGQRARAFAERNFELEHICDRFTKILGIDTAEVAAAPASVGERS
jgi:glycosyltransferase involved in cell wall biosynthesis